MVQKHYVDIECFKEKYMDAIGKNDIIHVSEKLDGAHSSFSYDKETNSVVAFSRKTKLSPENNLRGFYEWVMSLPIEVVKKITDNGRLIIHGEWMCPHTVRYPQEIYNHFYMYDVWDTIDEVWFCQPTVDVIYDILLRHDIAIRQPERFYYGVFKGWEHLYNFVGKTAVNAEPCGEGIVIKNQSVLNDKTRRLPTYIKIVSEKFTEVHKDRPKKILTPEELAEREAQFQLCESIVTKRRIEKFLDKFVDEGILPEDWDEHQLGVIAKNISRRIYEDCVKEEPETVAQIENFGKLCSKVSMDWVKEILKTK